MTEEQLRAAVESRMRDILAVEQKIAADRAVSAGACVECRYCVSKKEGYSFQPPTYRCHHPLVRAGGRYDATVGEVTGYSYPETEKVRAEHVDHRPQHGLCGPQGRLFEPPPVPLNWFWRLLRWLRLWRPEEEEEFTCSPIPS